jgi:hypothetical protein
MLPQSSGSVPEFDSSELAEAISLVFDCHCEDFGVFNEEAFGSGCWRSSGVFGRLGELTSVVEEVEVLDHELDNLRFVANIRSVGAIMCRFELDDSGFSLLLTVSDDVARV